MINLGNAIIDHSGLLKLQQQAMSMMRDTCAIRRSIGMVYDEVSGKTVEQWEVRYWGQCRLKASDTTPGTENSERLELSQQTSVLSLPLWAANAVKVGDLVELQSAWFNGVNNSLAGRTFRVESIPTGSLVTAARFVVTEVTG